MLAFAIIAIPLGLVFNFFDRFKFSSTVWVNGVFKYFAIFFILAIPLEFMFRGIVQNLVHARWDSEAEELTFRMSCVSRLMLKTLCLLFLLSVIYSSLSD